MCKKLIYVMAFVLALGSTAQAGVYLWNGSAGDGLWETPLNWTVTDSVWTWPNEEFGNKMVNSDTIAIDILNGDAVTREGELAIQGAADGSTTAVLTVNGSSLTVNGDLETNDGEGHIIISGNATVNVGDDLELANEPGGVGTVDISGTATVTLFDDIDLGKQGVGTLNISGDATLYVPDELYIGDDEGSVGHMNISGNATVTVDDDLDVGDDGAGTCDISENATVNVVDSIKISENGGEGHLTVRGTATVNVDDDIEPGCSPTGLGTMDIDEKATVNVGDDFELGVDPGGQGHLTISGDASVTCVDMLVGMSLESITSLTINGGETIIDDLIMGSGDGDPSIGQSRVFINGGLLQAEGLSIAITDSQIIFTGGEFRIGSASLDEASMQQLIDDGTIVAEGTYSITTDGDYTVLKSPAATEIDLRIADGGDDAEQHLNDNRMDIGSTDLEFPYEDAGSPTTDEQVVGLRFVDIPIDPGGAVFGAYVEIEVDKVDKEGSQAPVNIIVEGELAPDAAPFEDVAGNITDRATTTTKVKWSVPEWTEQNAKFQTPDLSGIIQEIVNQAGWESGNALVLILRDDKDNPSTGLREAEAYDGEADAAPLLHIAAELTVVKTATEPSPADGAEGVAIGTSLSWMPSSTAVSHDVYFGASSPPALVGNQDANTYYPGPVEPETTYYWQIDEVEADGTIVAGDIWSFTTGLGNVVASVRIADGDDDVEERLDRDGDLDITSTDLELAYEDEGQGDPQRIGLRFVNVGVPAGAELIESYLEFEVDNLKGGTEPVNVIIDAQLSPDAEPFVDEPYNVSNRTFTETVVPWSVPNWTQQNEKFQSPDITVLIGELISQEGWAPGNAMVFSIQDDPANPSLGVREAEAYDGEAKAAPLLQITAISEVATQPHPANGAVDVPLDATLSWWPGFSAVSHDGYIGTSSPPPLMGNTTEVSYDPGGLKPSTTYYWQINAVAADGTVYPGDIWSFTTVIGSATQPAPSDGALVVETSATLSWIPGVTAASHDVYIGDNYDNVDSGAEGTFVGNQTATSLTVGLSGSPLPDGLVRGTTYYWRVDEVEADGTTVYKGDVWSFTIEPFAAYNPNPADGATGVNTNVELSWTPGFDAKLHSVYFGDDLDTVSNAVGAPPMPFITYNPGPLKAGKTYYWRVDEFNPPVTTKGDVWSFTTAP